MDWVIGCEKMAPLILVTRPQCEVLFPSKPPPASQKYSLSSPNQTENF